MAAVQYLIDGHNIKTEYGVGVSASKGITSRPKLKALTSVDWDNYHGKAVDLQNKYYDVREITLSCFISASSRSDFINKFLSFEQLFKGSGTQRLVVDVGINKPLIFEVYCKDEINPNKKWSESSMVGTFDLKLVEPEPLKRVLKYTRTDVATKTCTITITTSKLVNIYWGDGGVSYDISGTALAVTHDYSTDGDYYPVITGCIDEISDLTTNATTIWTRL